MQQQPSDRQIWLFNLVPLLFYFFLLRGGAPNPLASAAGSRLSINISQSFPVNFSFCLKQFSGRNSTNWMCNQQESETWLEGNACLNWLYVIGIYEQILKKHVWSCWKAESTRLYCTTAAATVSVAGVNMVYSACFNLNFSWLLQQQLPPVRQAVVPSAVDFSLWLTFHTVPENQTVHGRG